MIEAIGIPVLMKAVDFLFDEGRKILQARRERKQSELQEAENMPALPKTIGGTQLQTKEIPSNSIQTKDEILHQKISEAAWSAHELEVQHLLSLAEINSRNYRLAKEQYAKWGSALVPPIIVNNLQEAESAVADTMEKLQATLSKMSDRPIVISELEEGQ